MIDRVHFENFKSLQHVTLDLGRLTALVGAHGCGKSSVLQGMHLLSEKARIPVSRGALVDLASLPRLAYRAGAGDMVISMRNHAGDVLRVARQGSPGETTITYPWTASGEFVSVAYLRLDARTMIRTSVAQDESPRMAGDGSNLASVLTWMRDAARDDLAQIVTDLRRLVPGVRQIRTVREQLAAGEPSVGDRFEIEFDDGSEIPADLLGEGTVLALGLLTKLREPDRPRLILIDDIDRGLHLATQTRLVEVIRAHLELDPGLQVVCATHSPYFLDSLEPAEVRVLALDATRRTHARRLTEHPELTRWKFGTQTGELWAALGEAWVVDGASGP